MGDGFYIDAVLAEGLENFAGSAGDAAHVFADDGDNREFFFDDYGIDFVGFDFFFEFFFDGFFGDAGGVGFDGETNGMFGGSLADQDDIDFFFCESAEKALGDAGDADHAAALELEKGDVVDGGDAFDCGAEEAAFVVDDGAGEVRLHGVFDADGDVFLHRWAHGWWVDYFGAEVGHFHRFFVSDCVECEGFFRFAWVGAHDAVDVGPDFDFFGVESGAKN